MSDRHVIRHALLHARESIVEGVGDLDVDKQVQEIDEALKVVDRTYPRVNREPDELTTQHAQAIRTAKTLGAAERQLIVAVGEISEGMIDRAQDLTQRYLKRVVDLEYGLAELQEDFDELSKRNARMLHERMEKKS